MDEKCHIDMLGLMILCSLITGISGQTDLNMFSSDGENISLSCNKALTDCTSTTWIYRGERRSETVLLSEKGIKKNDTERRERLSLGSDCSLNIYKATPEDHGHYTCRTFMDQFTDAHVYLHVLHVSPSSTQTEIRPGRSFTLSCQLFVVDGCPYDLFTAERIQLVWVNKAGVNLQSDSRFQISSPPEHCHSSLTTTLLDEDDNTEWTCQITDRTDLSQVKTSVSYTVTYLAENKTFARFLRVIILVIEIAVLTSPTVILLWIICERRADNRRRRQTPRRHRDMNNTE